MKIIRLLTLAVIPALLMQSCSNDELEGTGPGGSTGNGGDIRFEIGFAPQDGTVYGEGPQTRVATDNSFNSEWEDGDEIGLFAAAHGTSLSATALDNYINNVKLTYSSASGGSWSGPAYWPANSSSITALDFYAYYPYDAAATDPTAITFNVQTDQSGTTGGKSNYNISDLLTAKSDNTGSGWAKGSTVSLTFSHALAMVQVTIPVEGKGYGPSKNLTVTLRGVKAGASLDLSAISATPGNGITVPNTDNDAANITMYRVEQSGDANYETSYTYRALVPAQEVMQGASLFRFEHEQRQLLTDAPLAAKLEMMAGRAEEFERTMPATLVHTEHIEAAGQTFQMGQTGIATPVHNVTFTKDFYMSRYQVTNAQYAAFLNAKGIGSNGESSVTYYKDNFTTPATENQRFVSSHSWGVTHADGTWKAQQGYENHPVINVTWYGAKAYADWVGGSLPTEAQWEYACRAGSSQEYGMGYDQQITSGNLGDYAWYSDNNDPNGTKAVGQKKPNAYGLYDMHGNVWEWCSDWYDGYGGPVTDPKGPITSPYSSRVLRGGGWDFYARHCRSAYRYYYGPGNAYYFIGFRVVFVP